MKPIKNLPIAGPCYPDLAQRTTIITGGANGIGAAMVGRFHAQGARVFFCDVDETAGKRLAAELGPRVQFSRVNLMEEKQVVRWIDRVASTTGAIDVLVNNAAADPRIPFADTTVAQWDALFARNLRAYFLTSRESIKHMNSGRGSIINFASIVFHTGPAQLTAYAATKGGIIAFTRSLAREVGTRGIRVNTVSPGWVMTERQLKQFVTPAIKKMIRSAQCTPDLIQPDEIADTVLFLASSASRAITGQELLVDRGWAHS
jgi:D-xylose 1-dehydrogenase